MCQMVNTTGTSVIERDSGDATKVVRKGLTSQADTWRKPGSQPWGYLREEGQGEWPGQEAQPLQSPAGHVQGAARRHMWRTKVRQDAQGERSHLMSGLLGVGMDFR